jgi:hypothetical protein
LKTPTSRAPKACCPSVVTSSSRKKRLSDKLRAEQGAYFTKLVSKQTLWPRAFRSDEFI